MNSDGTCSFCGRPAAEAPTRLTARGATICAGCVHLAREVLELEARDPITQNPPRAPGEPRPGWLACAFCGRDQQAVRKLVAGPNVAICDGCLAGIAAA